VPPTSRSVPRDRLLNKLRELGFSFRSNAEHADFWRRSSDSVRVTVPRKQLVDEEAVRVILRHAGERAAAIEAFLNQTRAC